jgi:hypothetical protein
VTQITDFLNNPLVAPLYALLVVAIVDMLLGVYRSIQQGVFDWKKLPQILDSTVLQKVIPLAGLGVASYFVADGNLKTGLELAYITGASAALAAEVASLISKATGSFVATTVAQDKGTPVTLTALTAETVSPGFAPETYVSPPLAPQATPASPPASSFVAPVPPARVSSTRSTGGTAKPK